MLAEGRLYLRTEPWLILFSRLFPIADGQRRSPAGAGFGADQQRRRRLIVLSALYAVHLAGVVAGSRLLRLSFAKSRRTK